MSVTSASLRSTHRLPPYHSKKSSPTAHSPAIGVPVAHRFSSSHWATWNGALDAIAAAELVPDAEVARLRAAWLIASRARSAITLATAKTTDVLPTDRQALEAVARVMEYPPGSASRLEEDYLRTTRLARQVFEKRFYGPARS